MTEVPVVEAVDVTRTYHLGRPPRRARRRGEDDGEVVVHALRGVSFAVAAGEFVAIVGPSGSGKSTLLHMLGALDRPSSGALRFSGRDVSDLGDAELARLRNAEIGFVFQQFQLLARTSALANVGLPLIYRSSGRGERRRRASAALDSVGLGHRKGHHPAQLSGGEQQRVAIARALVTEPRLVLADEPTGNLDTVTGNGIIALLRDLNREQGVTMVIITHDPEVADHADRRIQIRDGRILAREPAR